ncbi:RagB/SusD family nutrient uptake outer membrane protein [uncultured Bacteroides sp.]|uniref:RagB/SusD family nutrient uptake outer membrane protein n=1 Tax=uncultured Bacteroides sp. TaxID=162156 RepID=UPI002AA801E8|nr:RagB/SusD family nutrient uptake outer membrane protein [uncultured Bacteroides sp.]
MKAMNFIIKGGVAMSLLVMCGCSSFLDETNIASQSAEEYYSTATGYESLINGTYETLKSVYNNINYFQFTQLGTDIGTQNYGGDANALNQYTVNYTNDNSVIYNQWKTLYAALKNVNAAIGRAKGVVTNDVDIFEGIDPGVLSQRVAEAKFLRALYLFEIVKNWGQAPLILEEPKTASTTAEYANGAAFYTQILQDLQDVLDSSLPMKQTSANYGRVSKAAAKHLRSLVYLTRGYQSFAEPDDFKKAYNDAVDVINNSGHALLDDYAMVHRQANEENNEIIFDINFSAGNNCNTNIQSEYYLFVYREGWTDLGFSSIYCNDYASVMPTKYAYELFDWNKDRRTQVTFMSPLNGNATTSVDGRTYGRNWFESTNGVNVAKGDTVIYFPVPGETSYKYYSDAEKKEANERGRFFYNYPTGSYSDVTNDDYYKDGYQSLNAKSRIWLPVWKFKDCNTRYNSSGTVENGTRDFYLFRLAETYLIAAEAAVKNNDNTDALYYINVVRKRAMNNAPESGLQEYTGTVTIDDVLNERALELYGEAPRWNDLQRTGKLAERVLKYNWDVTHITGGLMQTLLNQSSFESKYMYRPIPINWLNTLSNGQELGNNPGW